MKKVIRKIAGIFAAAAVAFSAVTLPDMGFLPGLTAPASAEAPTGISSFIALEHAFRNGGNYKLMGDINTDHCLIVGSGKEVTLDLNGFTIDRGLESAINGGHVIDVMGTLTVRDVSQGKTGKITGGKNTHDGGGIVVLSSGHFTLKSGTISGNETAGAGGGVCVEPDGTFTMTGGTISGNTATSFGGGVCNRGTFTMTGGSIQGNTATDCGGGVYNSGTFTMTGGTIQNNTGTDKGGGVIVAGGTLTMTGGSISGNRASDGGGVFVALSGTFTMSEGTISGNTAADSGGGVYVVEYGTFTMTGGEISGNTADFGGGGVFVALYGKFYLKNGVTVSGDVAGDGTIKHFDTVTITEPTGGTVTASGETVTVGETTYYIEGSDVTLTVTPAEGCKVGTVTYNDGTDHTINPDDGVYSFTMPAGDVTVGATFIEPTAVLDEETGVLTLQGNVIADEVQAYQGWAGIDSPVTAVVCKSGTVLPSYCSYLFSSFDEATVIDLSNADISGITNMNSMFEGCSKLTTIYVSSDWRKPGENSSRNMFYHCGNLLGGNGTRFANEDINGDNVAGSGTYAVIDGKDGKKGYLSVKPVISEASVTLKDDLGLNFIVGDANEYNSGHLSIKLTGNCAENGQTPQLTKKTIDGRSVYCVTANITASHMGDTITAQLYNGTLLLSTNEYSVNAYLSAVDTTEKPKLKNLVEKTAQYGDVSYAYFNNPNNMPTVTSHKDDLPAQTYAPKFKNGAEDKLSLVLNSKLAVRLYIEGLTAGETATYGTKTLTAVLGTNGCYFEITDILPTDMASDYTITYGGDDYTFKPLSWAYRVLSNTESTDKNKEMANALYEYYTAALAYSN